MGPLRNPRHEKFAQLIWLADTKNYRRGLAYQAAGYRATLDDKSKSCAADACACRLFKNAQIQARVKEIAATAARRNEVTEDSLIAELEQAPHCCARGTAGVRSRRCHNGQGKSVWVARRAERNRKTRRFRQYDSGRIESVHTNQLGQQTQR